MFGRQTAPVYLLYFITRQCDGKCRHCFFWKDAPDGAEELALPEIEKVSAGMGDLLQLTLTGGDAVLREDLPEIARIFYNNNHPKNITICTNSNRPELVERQISKVLNYCPDTSITVDSSMDGIGEDHDRIRGVPGLSERVLETHEMLCALRQRHPNLTLCLAICISHFNQEKAAEVYHFIRDKLKVDSINVLLIRGEPRDPKAKDVDLKYYEDLVRELEDDIRAGKVPGYKFLTDVLNAKDVLLRNIIIKTVKENRYQMPCTAGTLTGVLYPEGDVAPCELVDDRFGNVRKYNYDMKAIWQSRAAKEYVEKIKREKCYCIHQCFISNNILFQPKNYPSLLAEILRIKFGKMRRRRAGVLRIAARSHHAS
jgi:radical SAM protein with 4Fe4S-binding SPASM domain